MEIWGFQAPYPVTLRLPWGEIHIFPSNISEIIKLIKSTREKIERPGPQQYITDDFESAISCTNVSSFIIFESSISYNQTHDEIRAEVLNWCSSLMDVHCFIFETETYITSIYCFQRNNKIMKLKRVFSRAYHPLFPE